MALGVVSHEATVARQVELGLQHHKLMEFTVLSALLVAVPHARPNLHHTIHVLTLRWVRGHGMQHDGHLRVPPHQVTRHAEVESYLQLAPCVARLGLEADVKPGVGGHVGDGEQVWTLVCLPFASALTVRRHLDDLFEEAAQPPRLVWGNEAWTDKQARQLS